LRAERPSFEVDGVDNVIAYLLSQGARINDQDIYGLTPLHYAAMRGSRSGTPFLLSAPKVNIEVTTVVQAQQVELRNCYIEYFVLDFQLL
jgi:ankyrin repeat protein